MTNLKQILRNYGIYQEIKNDDIEIKEYPQHIQIIATVNEVSISSFVRYFSLGKIGLIEQLIFDNLNKLKTIL